MRVLMGRAIGRGLRDVALGWACGSEGVLSLARV